MSGRPTDPLKYSGTGTLLSISIFCWLVGSSVRGSFGAERERGGRERDRERETETEREYSATSRTPELIDWNINRFYYEADINAAIDWS